MREWLIGFLLILSSFGGPLLGAPKSTLFVHEFNIAHKRINVAGQLVWLVTDTAFYVQNPNFSQNQIRASLTAVNNPNFRFKNGQLGTYNFPEMNIGGYPTSGDCLNHNQPLGYSMFCFALDCPDTAQGEWQQLFSLRVESINSLQFYFYGPGDGFGAGGQHPTSPWSAYREGWQNFEDYIPVEWDSNISRWVAPWMNFWHNTDDFPRGWQTEVTVTNSSGTTLTYTVANQHATGDHGHTSGVSPAGCCDGQQSGISKCSRTHTFTTICDTFSVNSGSTVARDPFRFHVSDDDARAGHDSGSAIQVSSGNPSGSTVSVRVFPNTGGVVCTE